ncbi:MAG: hypothetical protein ABI584_07240 [Acidobacteriota bacterium]
MKVALAAVLALASAAGGSARAQAPTPIPPAPASTPAEQHVVAPSLPDQPNKEGVARPSGSMPTDSEGYVRTNRGAVDPSATPAPSTGVVGVTGGGTTLPAAAPAPPPGPTGPAEVKAAFLSLRGRVKAYAKGVSITIVEKNGRTRTVALAPGARVYEGLATGDRVVVRVPFEGPGSGKTADLVSRQTPPKAPPKSKFSAAQSPVR